MHDMLFCFRVQRLTGDSYEVLSVILVLPVQLKTASVMKPSILTSILHSNSFAGRFSAGDLIT